MKYFLMERLIHGNEEIGEVGDSEDDTKIPIRGTRPLADIYDRCNLAMLKPSTYIEAASHDHWRIAMKEELHMIEKNKT